jgi:hypothetical protein
MRRALSRLSIDRWVGPLESAEVGKRSALGAVRKRRELLGEIDSRAKVASFRLAISETRSRELNGRQTGMVRGWRMKGL